MARHKAITLVAVLLVSSIAVASDVIDVTSYGSGKQIWIDSAAFDSRSAVGGSPNFVEDATTFDPAETLTGTAYYSPANDDWTVFQPWYLEYSLNPADVPGVSLTGTWYFWARTYQPDVANFWDIAGGDSDLLFVKGDPEDGDDPVFWYQDSIDYAESATDRILNDMQHVDGWETYVPGTWLWWSSANNTTPPGGPGGTVNSILIEKEFTLIDNKITYRISERESGDVNARIDLMVWTDDPTYVPSDADFPGGAPVPGDADGDGVVDLTDLGILATNWGRTDVTVGAAEGDFDDSGTVDLSDLGILATNWGTGTEAVPEPATMSLLGLGALALIRRRR